MGTSEGVAYRSGEHDVPMEEVLVHEVHCAPLLGILLGEFG
jgi:hypothetical protein